jgi:hypothetical protein
VPNIIPTIAACAEGQHDKSIALNKCAGCDDVFLEGWAAHAGWHGICASCAIKTELGLIERPKYLGWWMGFDF